MKTTIRGLRHAVATSAATGVLLVTLAGGAFAQTNITVAVPNPSAITWAPIWAAIGGGYFEGGGAHP